MPVSPLWRGSLQDRDCESAFSISAPAMLVAHGGAQNTWNVWYILGEGVHVINIWLSLPGLLILFITGSPMRGRVPGT